jgi:DNA transformation protein and related proteins
MKRRRSASEPFHVEQRDTMRDWLEERLGAMPELEVRRLFGGAGLYSADTIFGIYYDGRVFLKVDARSRDEFVERGCEAFRPRSGRTLASYYEVPAEVLDDDAELLRWARRAWDAAVEGGKPPRRAMARSPEKKGRKKKEKNESTRRRS